MRTGVTFNANCISCVALEIKRTTPDSSPILGIAEVAFLRSAGGSLDMPGAARVPGVVFSKGVRDKAEELFAMIEAEVEPLVSSTKGIAITAEPLDSTGMFDAEGE